MKSWLILPVLLLSACESVRTVYDRDGREVEEHEGATQSDLTSRFQGEFNAAFRENRDANGVPQATSGRVSSFQSALDNSRRNNNEYLTQEYGAATRNDSRNVIYAGSNARYAGEDNRRERERRMAYGNNLRPDFMNETHGISHSQRYGPDASSRSSMDGVAASRAAGSSSYSGQSAGYSHTDSNSYVENRRNKTPQPQITNFREYYRQTINSTRSLLGRDNPPAGNTDDNDD